MRENLRSTPLFFEVLYESVFPSQAEDSLFSNDDIVKAYSREERSFEDLQMVLGCDVADKGVDQTVIMHAHTDGLFYDIQDIYSEAKSENVKIAQMLNTMQKETNALTINIDCIGVGVGVVSVLRNIIEHPKVKVNECHFGRKPYDSNVFVNSKAEQYWNLKTLFERGLIRIPKHDGLIKDLLSMKWEKVVGSNKIKVVDPDDHSPDFSDALVYTVWNRPKGSYVIR